MQNVSKKRDLKADRGNDQAVLRHAGGNTGMNAHDKYKLNQRMTGDMIDSDRITCGNALIAANCSKFDARTFRGKRANLFGTVVDNGILWTDISNGKQTFERYD